MSCGHTVSQLFRRGIRIQAKVQTKNMQQHQMVFIGHSYFTTLCHLKLLIKLIDFKNMTKRNELLVNEIHTCPVRREPRVVSCWCQQHCHNSGHHWRPWQGKHLWSTRDTGAEVPEPWSPPLDLKFQKYMYYLYSTKNNWQLKEILTQCLGKNASINIFHQ